MGLTEKENSLKVILRRSGSALIAFSGGVDSSVLLAVAAEVLPRTRLLAVTAVSPTYSAAELKLARRIARQLKVRHRVIRSREFDNPEFVNNPPERCYYCKHELFTELCRIARTERLAIVCDGTNDDDRNDYRPGRRAAVKLGVHSPLLEARITKSDLRRLAQRYHLPNWNKPAAACLASRIPYGRQLEPNLLRRIDEAEEFVRRQGFSQVRVRHHDTVCRLEIEQNEFARVIAPKMAQRIVRQLRRLGYEYVTLDLNGYQTGSMNRTLAKKLKTKAAGRK